MNKLISTYTENQAIERFSKTKSAFNANVLDTITNHHLSMLYVTESQVIDELNELIEDYELEYEENENGTWIGGHLFMFPHIPAYRWNMEQAAINRSENQNMTQASMGVVEYVEEQLYSILRQVKKAL